jgi:L,D-transpeptidase ErfK/SrfK
VPYAVALLVVAWTAGAAPAGAGAVAGEVGFHVLEPGESLVELAPRFDVGFAEIAAANPRLDPFVPDPGSVVLVPTRWIVPAATSPDTIVLNLSEMRLYLVRFEPPELLTFPVGIGDEANETPLGTFRIVAKHVAPTWYPPRSIREEDPELPGSVPPGPDNPLGSHALRLSRPTILIHGTNRPFAVGRRVSHGCVRLYPDDIARLFDAVEVGTRVLVVREPVKVAVEDGRVLVEVHDDPEVALDAYDEAVRLLAGRGVADRIDPAKLSAAAEERTGLPVGVGRDEP